MTREEALAQPGATESDWGRIIVTCPHGHDSLFTNIEGCLAARMIMVVGRTPHGRMCRQCDDFAHPTKDCSFRYEANIRAEGRQIYP